MAQELLGAMFSTLSYMSSKTCTTIGTLALVLVLAGSIFTIPGVVYADPGGQPNCPPQSNAPQCQGNNDGSGTGDEGTGSEESSNDESESASAAAKSGGRSWALVVKFVVGFNEQGFTQETIPESTTDITLYEAQNSVLGYNYFDTLRALGLLGFNPMDLTDTQIVWLLEHFHEIAGIVIE